MKTTKFLLGMLLMAFFLVGCDDEMPDYYASKSYDLENFNAVELGDALQVRILRGTRFSVVARGEQPDLDDLELRVEDGVLTGNYRNGSASHKRTKLEISMPQIYSAVFEAATDASISGFTAPGSPFFLKASGASAILMSGNFEELELRVEGASEIALKGQVDVMDAVVSGASRLYARELTASEASVDIGGASEADLYVTGRLEGSVQGSSLLRYLGDPEVLDVFVANDSRIIKF